MAATAKTTTRTEVPLAVAERANALREAVVAQTADRVEPARWGEAVVTPSLPRVWDLNFLRVDHLPRLAPARRVAAEAERVLGGAGLGHRKVVCHSSDVGLRLGPGLAARGWQAETLLVMAWTGGEPPAPDGEAAVREATFAELEPAYRWSASTAPGADGETVAQLVGEAERSRPARRLAAWADGEPASFCRVFSRDGVAEIDDVGTLPAHRRRGLSRAVVLTAVRWARETGHDVIFLRADERDWPRDFYARLGFATVARHHEFRRAA